MPYFKNDEINVLLIHIPKTGGTSIEQYFSNKYNIELNNKSLFLHINDENLLNKHLEITSSLQHITYNQILKYSDFLNIDFENMKIITVVRNPYERIISDLFFFKLCSVDTPKDNVFEIIKEYLSGNCYYNDGIPKHLLDIGYNKDEIPQCLLVNYYDNHNIPQYKFITNEHKELIPNINILKTESLNDDMIRLGYEDFNIYMNKNANKVNYYDYLNDKSIELINDFYHDDFVLFGYNKINTVSNN